MNHSAVFLLIFIIIIVTYFIASTYAFDRIGYYFSFKYPIKPFLIALILFALVPFGMIIQQKINTVFTTYVYNASFLIFGFVLGLVIFTIIIDLIRLIFKHSFANQIWGLIIIGLTLLFVLIAFINTVTYKEINIDLNSSKISKDTKIVQISDVHLFGKTSEKRFDKIYKKVVELNPDIVVITGDLFDTPGTIPSNSINVINDYNIPVYFIFGNHDIMYGEENSIQILKNTNTIILNDTKVIDKERNISMIGVTYAIDPGTLGKVLQTINIDMNEYNILLYHAPVGAKDASNKGIDLMLSGHTHGGQVFPLTALIGLMYDYVKGEYKVGNMTLYVNEGTGLWGPKMRLPTRNEITVFNIKKE